MVRPRRSLRIELLVNLGFVTSAAVLLVGVTTVALSGGDLREIGWPLLGLWLGSTAVFALYGAHLVHRLVIRPLRALAAGADALAAGDLSQAGPATETAELAHLGDRFRAMAEDLLDVQSQVIRVEKLAGIGRLAAGVAHEVRNPLGALSTYVEVLRRRGADTAVTSEMHRAIERIERTVQSLLDYAGPGSATSRADLNQAVGTAAGFLSAQGMFPGRSLAVDLEGDLPPVVGDRHALEQVVLNLLINARQAAPAGTVTVGTVAQRYAPSRRDSARKLDGEKSPTDRRGWTSRPRRRDLAPGTPGAVLYVADSGPGVAEADRERIFDPFFTTKEPGEGTGLGLAIVARTVHEAGGVVWVDRAREGGAVFKIFLPLAGGTDACADR
ncbi:MAG: HAMP domain-containing protein [Gemmatimonadales bacterium]|nr:HAMP domain-containing protein [Gemmatimonadales bacterium]